jgi:shikimate kinase
MSTPPLRARNERIYLTGFMGSGKSTIGPIVANTIGYGFVDLDRRIEEQEGCTIAEIFRVRGEQAFRLLEHQILSAMAAQSRLVVSLGGGTVTVPRTFDLVRSSGIVVYLSIAEEELLRRLRRRSDRPLLNTPTGERLPDEQLRERVRALYAAREPLYRQADLIVPTDERRLGLTVDRLVKLLTPHLR